MKKIAVITFISILFSIAVNAQDFVVEKKNIIGEWTAKIPADRSSSMDVLFDGSTLIFNEDFSYSANVMEKIEGTWTLSENTAILRSENAPSDMILNFKEDGSCVWEMKKNKVFIPFFKNLPEK